MYVNAKRHVNACTCIFLHFFFAFFAFFLSAFSSFCIFGVFCVHFLHFVCGYFVVFFVRGVQQENSLAYAMYVNAGHVHRAAVREMMLFVGT
jgi:hypothetical protein